MKANAKKLLALIMAMVMCLSLAAPAMAAGADAAADVTLSTQEEVAYVTALTANGDNGFTVTVTTATDVTYPIGGGVYAWDETSKYPSAFVTYTTEASTDKRVGQFKKTKYSVSPKNVQPGKTVNKIERIIADKPAVQYSLKDADIAWATLTGTQNWYGSSSVWQVSGSIYQEQQPDGNWLAYFKLSPRVKDSDGVTDKVTNGNYTIDTATTAEPVYYKYSKSDGTKLSTDKQIRDALAALDTSPATVNEYGAAATAVALPSVKMDANITAWTYSYAVVEADGATVATPTDFGGVTFTGVATTATIKGRATYDANEHDSNTFVVDTKPETDAEKLKADLEAKSLEWSVSSISMSGEYFTVVISKNAGNAGEESDAFDTARSADAKNVTVYTVGGLDKDYNEITLAKVGLTDLSKSGTYYATNTDTKLTTINAGTKVYGAVAVKTADIPEDVVVLPGYATTNGDYTYFSSESVMKYAMYNRHCGKTQTISYKKLVVNDKNDKKTNKFTVNGWATETTAFTEDGTWTMDKYPVHTYLVTKTTIPSTCKTPGSETDTEACIYCGDVKSTTTKALPVDKSNVKATTKEAGYVVTPSATDTHYIKEEKITTTLKTKTTKGSIKHEYICSLGEIHDEFTWTEETDKEEMEYSGKWDKASWGTKNTANVKNPALLYGYTATVCDSDFVEATLPINGDYMYFQFNGAAPQADGTYYGTATVVGTKGGKNNTNVLEVNVVTKDANGNKLKTKTEFLADVLVKDIKAGEKDCQDGSATIEINVYKSNGTAGYADITPDKVADSIKDKKVALVKTHTQAVVVPAEKTHVDANNDGKCDNCSTEINQTSPVTENTVDISKAVVTFDAMTYTGKAAQPTVTVTLDGVKLAKGVDYEVEEMQDVNVGTYPLIVKGKGDFSGRVVGNVTIKKAANTLKVSATTVNVKVKDVKKKAKTYALKVTKAKGTVTVKSNNKNVSWKSNKITVKKGTKKATVKLTVKAKGNANYKAGTKTVKVVIK